VAEIAGTITTHHQRGYRKRSERNYDTLKWTAHDFLIRSFDICGFLRVIQVVHNIQVYTQIVFYYNICGFSKATRMNVIQLLIVTATRSRSLKKLRCHAILRLQHPVRVLYMFLR
jgi:hypothetical protein